MRPAKRLTPQVKPARRHRSATRPEHERKRSEMFAIYRNSPRSRKRSMSACTLEGRMRNGCQYGTVTKVQWTSPHVMTYIDVKDNSGKITNWKVELGSPTQLTKIGWTRDMLKVGEMINLQGWQAKNGTNFANAEEVTMANGQKLSAASSYDSIKREGVATSGSKTPKPEGNEKSTAPKSTAPKSTAPKSTAPKY